MGGHLTSSLMTRVNFDGTRRSQLTQLRSKAVGTRDNNVNQLETEIGLHIHRLAMFIHDTFV